MKIGRNEPCPCGSGKKFKKCCIDQPEYQWHPPVLPLPKTRVDDLVVQHDTDEVGFMEHPTQIKVIFNFHWSPEKILKMDNKMIFKKFRAFGLPLTEHLFRTQTDTVDSAQELVGWWFSYEQLNRLGKDRYFPLFAARVLWERLRPDKPCFEQFAEWMEQGYEWWPQNEIRTFTPWWTLWESVKTWAKHHEIRNIEVLDEQLHEYVINSFQNWLNDFDTLLHHLCLCDQMFARRRLELARDAEALFTEADALTRLNWGRAQGESLFRLDDPEGGDVIYRRLVEQFPDDAWVYIGWGDEYSPEFAAAPAYIDPTKALQIYSTGLKHGTNEDEEIQKRIQQIVVPPTT
ncbi:SEC-C domain-containing protein [Alicyclobacillus tolerans]|uniref:YecA family protein n=1 Tax=Alicyclobacillus tolerans TaxID=90970 RepID=UPI001F3A6F5F|nr:SEC-C metal-binding domain-containing protein [Alicyclobacillus tolerans]MCF8567067.1 SEC-C domain-containing protein [Alicyclobacillus tolerans]